MAESAVKCGQEFWIVRLSVVFLLQPWHFWHVSFIFESWASISISFNVLDCLYCLLVIWSSCNSPWDHIKGIMQLTSLWIKWAITSLKSSSSLLKVKLWDGRFQITNGKSTERQQPVSPTINWNSSSLSFPIDSMISHSLTLLDAITALNSTVPVFL